MHREGDGIRATNVESVRHLALHDTLFRYVESAATVLQAARECGEEMSFEVAEGPGRTTLYEYRPLVAEFIDRHREEISQSAEFAVALSALRAVDGVDRYVREFVDGAPSAARHERAADAAVVFLKRLWEGSSDFAIDPDRLEERYRELESFCLASEAVCTIVAPVPGLGRITGPIEIGSGFEIRPGGSLDELPVELGSADDDRPLVVLVLDRDPHAPLPIAPARLRFRRTVEALRLFKEGGVTLGPVAWGRIDDGRWTPFSTGARGTPRGPGYSIDDAEAARFASFASHVGRLEERGDTAWAAARFVAGCERSTAVEGLTDHLLGLRALLDEDSATSPRLPIRVAALVSDPEARGETAAGIERASVLERHLMRGCADIERLSRLGVEDPAESAACIENHLRSILVEYVDGSIVGDARHEADRRLLAAGVTETARVSTATGGPAESSSPTPAGDAEEGLWGPRRGVGRRRSSGLLGRRIGSRMRPDARLGREHTRVL